MSTSEPAAFPVAFHRPEAERRVVILPGARYPTRAPLLWFAREVAIAKGFGVLELLDEPPAGSDPFAWVRDRATRALDHEPAPTTVVIGKSLSSHVADLARDRELPAIWLTPLLDRQEVRDAIANATRPAADRRQHRRPDLAAGRRRLERADPAAWSWSATTTACRSRATRSPRSAR